jgi:hypothetical protein
MAISATRRVVLSTFPYSGIRDRPYRWYKNHAFPRGSRTSLGSSYADFTTPLQDAESCFAVPPRCRETRFGARTVPVPVTFVLSTPVSTQILQPQQLSSVHATHGSLDDEEPLMVSLL